jgi:RNA polymerase sigma factor (TIGR02999 family)
VDEPRSAVPGLTRLLDAWRQGEGAAKARVFDLAYVELKRIAAQRLRQSGRDLTLTPTALLHEAYLRIAETPLAWSDSAHFYASMSLVIRGALVDYARARNAAKRGDPDLRVTLTGVQQGEESMAAEVLALDQALTRLQALDPRAAEVLHLTHFGGLDREQIAAVLKVSLSSVDRDLRFSRVWLREELAGG